MTVNAESAWIVYQTQGKRPALKRFKLADQIGPVNLDKASKDLRPVIGALRLEPGSRIQEIELVLRPSGHSIVEGGEKVCDVKVPSDRFSAKAHPSIQVIDGRNILGFYFDHAHSVIEKSSPRDCIVKPVVELTVH